jgi:3-oxoacyl-[acyl-carrier-protein] synthase-3
MRDLESQPQGSVHDTVWTPGSELAVRIVGAGAYVPPHAVTTKEIARAIPGWPAEQIIDKTGILERRYLWPLDVEQGCATPPALDERSQPATATDMAEVALKSALDMATMRPRELDLLIVVTCTPDQPHFSHDAMTIQRRLDIRRDAHCLVVDSGCGGSLYLMDMVVRMLESGTARTAAIVGVNFSSPLLDRRVYSKHGPPGENGKTISPYLSAYVFGDGAGALVLRSERSASLGVQASIAGNDCQELVRSPGGGALSPPYGDRYRAIDHAFVVDGRLVASTYFETMGRCMTAVTGHVECPLEQVDRFYLHQPNRRILGALADRLRLRDGQVASNVALVGNTSSAGMFMLLADDLESGRVALGSGTPVVFAGIGAGVHYGAQFVKL